LSKDGWQPDGITHDDLDRVYESGDIDPADLDLDRCVTGGMDDRCRCAYCTENDPRTP